MRILVDENLAPAVAVWLRVHGHDATHVRDEGLGGASDVAVLAKAQAERRVLLTMDLDFGES